MGANAPRKIRNTCYNQIFTIYASFKLESMHPLEQPRVNGAPMAGQITRYPKPEPEKPEPEPEPEKTKPEKPEHYFG